ncbi:hypothetical protein LX32DRAFT_650534 [Colletotrichum zoysiae]|uniref:Uncharacterized protein n=1 Tax=Colletotrichum zoysiae TaxID=1216348 RepID=A0AAD9HMJ1_9PEZI|nr:hypothetical protein LX32DRAFT_650534 [Colletotrichum zoysiae]
MAAASLPRKTALACTINGPTTTRRRPRYFQGNDAAVSTMDEDWKDQFATISVGDWSVNLKLVMLHSKGAQAFEEGRKVDWREIFRPRKQRAGTYTFTIILTPYHPYQRY